MKTQFDRIMTLIVATLWLVLALDTLRAQPAQPAFSPNRILVRPLGNLDALHRQLATTVLRRYPNIGNLQVGQLPQGLSVAQAVAQFQSSGEVWYAEPGYIVYPTVTIPTDPKYADGTLWRLNNSGQNGGTADADLYHRRLRFRAWSDPDLTFVPGEGFIIQPGAAWSHSFVGEVAQGYGVNPVPNLQSIRSSIVPQGGRVVTDLKLPVLNGDTVTRMINGTYTTYTFSGGVWSPSEPVVSVGESFWNNKNVGFNWNRNYLTWP